jgi:hypothetical protein
MNSIDSQIYALKYEKWIILSIHLKFILLAVVSLFVVLDYTLRISFLLPLLIFYFLTICLIIWDFKILTDDN